MKSGLRSPSPSSSTSLIPYYILERLDGLTRVLFLVPAALVGRLTVHPILCRGSTFVLVMDENSNNQQQQQFDDDDAAFLAVDFESPYPEDLAREIALRLTRRLDDALLDQEASPQSFLTLG